MLPAIKAIKRAEQLPLILACCYLPIWYYMLNCSIYLHLIMCLIGYKWRKNALFTDFLWKCVYLWLSVYECYQFFLLSGQIITTAWIPFLLSWFVLTIC